MDQNEFYQILQKYLSDTASEDEKKIIDEWYDAMGKSKPESQPEEIKENYWNAISESIENSRVSNTRLSQKVNKMGGRFLEYSIGIAASMAIVILMGLYLFTDNGTIAQKSENESSNKEVTWRTITNTKSISEKVVLPDGSTIVLEPKSWIKLPSDFNENIREVKFSGKAFFEIAHNPQSPFRVYANEVVTKVLGTSFTIDAFPNDKNIIVSVKTGSVSVTSQGDMGKSNELILTPNKQIVYDRNKSTVSRGLVESPQPIIEANEIETVRFEAAPVKEIFETLEKIYGIEIEFNEALYTKCKLTTSVGTEDVYNRLDIITSAIGASYFIKEDVIVVTGKECK